MRQQPKSRPDDGQHTPTNHRANMREGYDETGERGLGLLHAIVSHKTFFYNHLYRGGNGKTVCHATVTSRLEMDVGAPWQRSPVHGSL